MDVKLILAPVPVRITRAAMVIAALGGPVSAQTICDALDASNGEALALPQGRAECQTSLALGGARSLHCALEFSYRSDKALAVFEGLVAELTACAGPNAVITQDQSVNHPDAYDLRMFEDGARVYAVSIKDKGALQQTLVFLRVQRP